MFFKACCRFLLTSYSSTFRKSEVVASWFSFFMCEYSLCDTVLKKAAMQQSSFFNYNGFVFLFVSKKGCYHPSDHCLSHKAKHRRLYFMLRLTN